MTKLTASRSLSASSGTYNLSSQLSSSSDIPANVLHKIQETLTKSDDLLVQAGNVDGRGRHLLGNLNLSASEKLDVGDLVEMDRALQAINWVEAVRSIGKQLDDIWSASQSVNPAKKKTKEDESSKVVDLHRVLVALVASLLNSTCSNLRGYAVQMLECHRERWIAKLEKQLEEDLEALHFPKCILDTEQSENDEGEKGKSHSGEFLSGRSTAEDMIRVNQLQERYRMLCDLRLPEEVASALKGFRVSDPLAIILKPLKKRFIFHFSGNKKTNNPEKPEWYLQQVGAWMRNSQKFFDVCIHPSRRHGETSDFPGHAQFCCGLLTLVIKKLRLDIAEVIYDDVTLSHLIDEVILFSRDVLARDFALFIPLDSLPLVVLCDSTAFARWISLERKFAFEKVDDLLLEEGSWHPSVARHDVSKCTLTFEALLQSITNRYKSLTSVNLQLNFVDLQIELLEDLRLRLAQILRQEQAFPLSEKFCLILSSSQYIVDMLSHWSEIPVFLQLQHERYKEAESNNPNSSSLERRGLFQDIADGFDFLVSDLIKTLAEHVFYEVKSRSKPYRTDVKWFSYTVIEDEPPWDTTPESFPMFQILAAHLTYLSKLLSGSALLTRIVSQVCDRLCNFFITDVILENVFSIDGCKQINVDVGRGLYAIFEPILSTSDKTVESYEELKEVCQLLTLKQANAILLLESLRDKKKNVDGKTILEEFNIHFLTAEQSIKILKRRIDLQ